MFTNLGREALSMRIAMAVLARQLYCVLAAMLHASHIRIERFPDFVGVTCYFVLEEDARLVGEHRAILGDIISGVCGEPARVGADTVQYGTEPEVQATAAAIAKTRNRWSDSKTSFRGAWATGTYPELALPVLDEGLLTADIGPFDEFHPVTDTGTPLLREYIAEGLCACQRCAGAFEMPIISVLSGNRSFDGRLTPMGRDLEVLDTWDPSWFTIGMSDLTEAAPQIAARVPHLVHSVGATLLLIARGGLLGEADRAAFRQHCTKILQWAADEGVEVHIALGHADFSVDIAGTHEHATPSVAAIRIHQRLLAHHGLSTIPPSLQRAIILAQRRAA